MSQPTNRRSSFSASSDDEDTTRRRTTASVSSQTYEDNIWHYDCRPCWRRCGLQRCFRCGRGWCVKDVCGVICCVITWGLVLYASYVVFCVMLIPSNNLMYSYVNGIIFATGMFLAVASHSKAMLTDPGAVPKGNATKENIAKLGLRNGQVIYKCPKCVSIKPERAHHCSVCRRCIKKMDHHCPWVNNCVGECNQKYFILFTFYICMMSIHALYMTIRHFVVCIKADWKEELCSAYSPAATTIMLIFLIFEGLLFGIFTAIMCGTQLASVCSDETGIEQLKNEKATWEKKSWWWSLKAVFGHPFSWRWFSPFHGPSHIRGRSSNTSYTV